MRYVLMLVIGIVVGALIGGAIAHWGPLEQKFWEVSAVNIATIMTALLLAPILAHSLRGIDGRSERYIKLGTTVFDRFEDRLEETYRTSREYMIAPAPISVPLIVNLFSRLSISLNGVVDYSDERGPKELKLLVNELRPLYLELKEMVTGGNFGNQSYDAVHRLFFDRKYEDLMGRILKCRLTLLD